MNIPRNNDKNTRIRRGLNTLREMNAERIPAENVCRCARRKAENGVRDSSNKRLTRNSNAISPTNLRTNTSLISRIPDGDTRTRIATTSISSGQTTPAGEIETTVCPVALSSQMQATFQPGGNCPCLDALVIDMDWSESLGYWRGFGAGCGGNVYLVMIPFDPNAVYVGASADGYPEAFDTAEAIPASCSPFLASGSITSDQESICGVVPADSINIDISER